MIEVLVDISYIYFFDSEERGGPTFKGHCSSKEKVKDISKRFLFVCFIYITNANCWQYPHLGGSQFQSRASHESKSAVDFEKGVIAMIKSLTALHTK